MTTDISVFFFAVDKGAQSVIRPLAEQWQVTWRDSLPVEGIAAFSALVLGSSTSAQGIVRDREACLQANAAGMPVVAIEDYPGNCSLLINEMSVDHLVVESDYSARHYVRLGFPRERITVLPSVRYDKYRNAGGKRIQLRKFCHGVLCIGQPESGMAQAVFGWLAPWCKRHGITIYFRAHPRDEAYHNGFWHRWFRRRKLRWVDCTDWEKESLWSAPLRFVATAFSSMAVEASFKGIPSVHILHPRPVKRLLADQKAGIRPAVVALGASAATFTSFGEEELRRCLSVSEVRRIDRAFVRHYRGDGVVIDELTETLEGILQAIMAVSKDHALLFPEAFARV